MRHHPYKDLELFENDHINIGLDDLDEDDLFINRLQDLNDHRGD